MKGSAPSFEPDFKLQKGLGQPPVGMAAVARSILPAGVQVFPVSFHAMYQDFLACVSRTSNTQGSDLAPRRSFVRHTNTHRRRGQNRLRPFYRYARFYRITRYCCAVAMEFSISPALPSVLSSTLVLLCLLSAESEFFPLAWRQTCGRCNQGGLMVTACTTRVAKKGSKPLDRPCKSRVH